MKLCSALLAALLAAALMSASAAPAEVCVLSITANKPASLNGAALSSLHAALTEIAKGAPSGSTLRCSWNPSAATPATVH